MVLSLTDMHGFIFVTITHEGELKQSTRFEITEGKLQEVSAKMSPNVPPEKGGGEPAEDDSDCDSSVMDIDANNYVPPE
jgi:hypothetical protein